MAIGISLGKNLYKTQDFHQFSANMSSIAPFSRQAESSFATDLALKDLCLKVINELASIGIAL